MQPTLHDVARLVGVSTRTVSRVVNDEGGFSAATGARVRAAIEELDYRPNLLARGLITRRTMTIGLVGGSMTDPFFPELAEGVQRAAWDSNLITLFAATDDDHRRQQQVIDSLRSRAVDGIIVVPAQGAADAIQPAVDDGLNAVVINPAAASPLINSINSDIEAGARQAVEHLLSRGRRTVAFLGNARPSSIKRERGYRRAIGARPPLIVETVATAEGAVTGTAQILAQWPYVDAIFVYNDVMAMATLAALNSANRSVPDDVAVVGFDNIGLTAHLNPPLTTVDLHQEALGRAAVELLVSTIDDPQQPTRQISHPVELVVRSST